MDNIDWNKIRDNFPIFRTQRNGKDLVYLDSSATSQKPEIVIKAINELYEQYNANIHRGVYHLSEETTARYEESKKKVASFIHAPSYTTIIYTRNTTESINQAALMLSSHIEEGDEILVSLMEHHSNLIPWMKVCERKGAKLVYIPVEEDGTINMSTFSSLVSKRTKILAISHVSNVLGTINPVKEMSQIVRDAEGIVVVDGAQAVGHIPVDVMDIGADMYAFSGHKMFAPTGIGVLYMKEKYLDELDPVYYGGDMVSHVEKFSIAYNDMPYKFEAGTSNFEGGIALGEAVEYIQTIGGENITLRNDELRVYMETKLAALPNIHIYGNAEHKSSVTAFSVDGIHPHDIASLLDKDNICIRAGMHCAEPLVNSLGHLALCRASLHVYNNEQDIDVFVDSLSHILDMFHHG